MTTTVTGKLTKAANEFQAGESIGFGLRVGKQYYDRETKQKEWTNYEAVIFAKAPAQIDFYRSVLIEGTVIEVTAESEKIRKFEGANGLVLSIELIDAKLGYTFTGQAPQQNAVPQPMQQAPQQAPMQQQAQQAPQAPQAPQQNFQPAPQYRG
jgi:hypothetical protein